MTLKKLVSMFLFPGMVCMIGAGNLCATTITDTLILNVELADTMAVPVGYSYVHDLEKYDIPAAATLNSATLSLTHKGNSDDGTVNRNELWMALGADGVSNLYIGTLAYSDNDWVTQDFVLGKDLLDLLSDHYPWSLQVRFNEGTRYTDCLSLARSELTVDYSTAPAPEPASMLLFGSGFLGMLGFSIRKMRSKISA